MLDDLASLIAQVKQGHIGAYEPIVRRFQDMAVGYGYARLGDFQLAEDAAQEAFIAAYFDLPSLQEPQAFPGWFRRIVIKQIDRIRRKRRSGLSLDDLSNVACEQRDLADMVEQQEVHDALLSRVHGESDELPSRNQRRARTTDHLHDPRFLHPRPASTS